MAMAFRNTQAMLRDMLNNNVFIIVNAGVPTAATGPGVCGKGSLCIDYTNAKLYINGGTLAVPDWKIVTSA